VADASTVFGAYRRFSVDVTAEVKSTEKNVLAVEVIPPKKGEPTVGWVDWNPAPPDKAMGLFREVRVRTTGPVSIENPFVRTKLDLQGYKEARLTVSAELINHGDRDITGTLEGQLEGARFSREVTLRPKESRKIEFTPKRPPSSWSRTPGLVDPRPGNQELYALALSFDPKKDKADEEAAPAPPPDEPQAKPRAKDLKRMPGAPRAWPSDYRLVRFGIREVADYRNEQGHRGFMLNGRKILIRGGGWADDLLLDAKPKKLAAEVLYARHMNLNALRLEGFWGTSESFYDLCDRVGLLVMVGWSCIGSGRTTLAGPPTNRTAAS